MLGLESWPMGFSDIILLSFVRIQPGRPKKARNRALDEPNLPYKASQQEYLARCENCGIEGHTARSCPHPENPNKKVWKKKTPKVTSCSSCVSYVIVVFWLLCCSGVWHVFMVVLIMVAGP